MGPADEAMAEDGTANHGVTQLATAFVVADQETVTGMVLAVLGDVLFFKLRDQIEQDALGFPKGGRERPDATTFDAITLDDHIAQGVEEILLKEDSLVADKSSVIGSGEVPVGVE